MSAKVLAIAIVPVLLCGCAGVMDKANEMGLGKSSTESLTRESAKSIGGGLALENVKVSNIDRGASTVKWTATTPGGTYSCNADDMLRSTYCAKK